MLNYELRYNNIVQIITIPVGASYRYAAFLHLIGYSSSRVEPRKPLEFQVAIHNSPFLIFNYETYPVGSVASVLESVQQFLFGINL